jgi:hypothetical protein
MLSPDLVWVEATAPKGLIIASKPPSIAQVTVFLYMVQHCVVGRSHIPSVPVPGCSRVGNMIGQTSGLFAEQIIKGPIFLNIVVYILMVILQTFICKHLLGPDNLLRSVSESN